DCDTRRERRQHGGQCDGLPQHDGGARSAHRPSRPRQHCRDWSRQEQRDDGKGQRGHAVSISQPVPGLPAGGTSVYFPLLASAAVLLSNSASARRSAAASSAPTRSTKCTSAASRLPESATWWSASTISPATSSSRPCIGAYRWARSSRCWTTRFFFASRCNTVMIVVYARSRWADRASWTWRTVWGSREDHRWSITARSRSPRRV